MCVCRHTHTHIYIQVRAHTHIFTFKCLTGNAYSFYYKKLHIVIIQLVRKYTYLACVSLGKKQFIIILRLVNVHAHAVAMHFCRLTKNMCVIILRLSGQYIHVIMCVCCFDKNLCIPSMKRRCVYNACC